VSMKASTRRQQDITILDLSGIKSNSAKAARFCARQSRIYWEKGRKKILLTLADIITSTAQESVSW